MTPAATNGLRAELRARRALSFTGVAPLAAYFLVHLGTTAASLGGAARFERVIGASRAVQVLLAVFVLGPLAFHAVYGASVLARSGARGGRLPAAAWMPRLRRAAAFATLAFLTWHLFTLPGLAAFGGLRAESYFDALSADLSSTTLGIPVRALAYLVGIAATSFHFATTLWTFCTTWFTAWFLGASEPTKRRYGWALGAVGTVAFLVGGNTVVFLATGSRIVGPRASLSGEGPGERSPESPCPQPQTESK